MEPPKTPPIGRRKGEHLEIVASQWPRTRTTTLLEEVTLIPDTLPQLDTEHVQTAVTFLGKNLSAPVMVTSLTGGTPETARLNRMIAQAAQESGLAFGLGSGRAMLENPAARSHFAVRDVAPDILLLANIGIAQIARHSVDTIRKMVDDVEADALAVHLNVAQELIQPEGDRSFRGTLIALEGLISALDRPVMAKAVGAGIDRSLAIRLANMGIHAIDVAGVGGTSWTALEGVRAGGNAQRAGQVFRDWGIPTAANLLLLNDLGVPLVGSGGITNGLDGARALAIGATVVGLAGPVIRWALHGGQEKVNAMLGCFIQELKMALFLTGCTHPHQLPHKDHLIGQRLAAWERIKYHREGGQKAKGHGVEK